MLYVFVEGNSDECFFSKIFFKNVGVEFFQYAAEKHNKTNKFIKTIKKVHDWDYLFFGDSDGKSISDKSKILTDRYDELEKDKLFVVQYEIESWYYAGVSEDDCQKLDLERFEHPTDKITKEMLISKMVKPSDRQYIMDKMLDVYSIELAEKRNKSFKIFSDYMRKTRQTKS